MEKVLSSGQEGLNKSELEDHLSEEGFSEGVVKAAIERLQDEDQVKGKER